MKIHRCRPVAYDRPNLPHHKDVYGIMNVLVKRLLIYIVHKVTYRREIRWINSEHIVLGRGFLHQYDSEVPEKEPMYCLVTRNPYEGSMITTSPVYTLQGFGKAKCSGPCNQFRSLRGCYFHFCATSEEERIAHAVEGDTPDNISTLCTPCRDLLCVRVLRDI